MSKKEGDTLKAYIALIWEYKPKNKRVPCLKDWIENDVKKNQKAWEKEPARRLNNAVYSYRVQARSAERKKNYKRSAGSDALVKNSNLLADNITKDKKIPFDVRKSFIIEGIGIEAPQPVPPKPPLRKELLKEAREIGIKQEKSVKKHKQKRTKEEKRKRTLKKYRRKHGL